MDYLNTYKRLLALADAGLFYGKDAFDQERYQELRELTLQLVSTTGHEAAVLPDLEKILTKEEGYPTPKVDVRGLIKKENRFLLVEDLRTKEWSLPGGYAEIGCSPKENIEKEVLEETGLVVTAKELLAVYDTDKRKDIPQLFQYYKMIFSCEILENHLFEKNIETSNCAYFSLDNLPPLSIKRTTKEQLMALMNQTTGALSD